MCNIYYLYAAYTYSCISEQWFDYTYKYIFCYVKFAVVQCIILWWKNCRKKWPVIIEGHWWFGWLRDKQPFKALVCLSTLPYDIARTIDVKLNRVQMIQITYIFLVQPFFCNLRLVKITLALTRSTLHKHITVVCKISWNRLFGAGNQSDHQNFNPSLTTYKCWLIFLAMEQKKKEKILKKKLKVADSKKLSFFSPPILNIFSRKFQGLVLWSVG